MTSALAAFLSILLWLASPALAQEGVHAGSATLKNGMEIVVVPNHRVPMVVHELVYRVGSADDPPGRSGLAHFQEHMMFLGTKTVPAGEYARILTKLGAEKNASTSNDYTVYTAAVAKENLPRVMELEADRMLNMQPPAADFLRERKVIIEERRMRTDNEPQALLSEAMRAMLFRNHPYRNPAIGWLHEMEALSEADVLAFHQRFYYPANAVLVLVGDITLKEATALAERYYGGLPNPKPAPRAWNTEPPQRGERRITLRDEKIHQPVWGRIYMAPSLVAGDTRQAMPLYLFAQALGGGSSSRLYQSLVVKQKLAVSVSADYQGFAIGPGEFSVEAVPVPGVPLAKLEAAVDAELAKALAEDVPADQLTRAKTLFKADMLYARDSLEGMASIMAIIRALSLPVDLFDRWPHEVDQVTAAQIKAAAAQTVRLNQSVTALLLPEAKP